MWVPLFNSFGYIFKSGAGGSLILSHLTFWGTTKLFHSGHTTLHSYQQCMRVLVLVRHMQAKACCHLSVDWRNSWCLCGGSSLWCEMGFYAGLLTAFNIATWITSRWKKTVNRVYTMFPKLIFSWNSFCPLNEHIKRPSVLQNTFWEALHH